MADATDQAPKDLVGFLDFYLVKKAPFQLPDGFKEFLVKFGPWIALLFLILGLPLILLALGLTAIATPFAMASGSIGGVPWALAMLAQLLLCAAALPGLMGRKMFGWKLLFYSQLVGMVAALLSFSFVNLIVGGLISLYLLFQIRSKYN
jgi:hypothetical protein